VAGVKLRIVQANVSQVEKLQGGFAGQHFEKHLALTRDTPGLDQVTHVIWPESAANFLLDRNPEVRQMIASVVPPKGALLTGTVRAWPSEGDYKEIWNSLVVIDPQGAIRAHADKAQLVPLIKGAMAHGGAAFIDVISPCVTFNNHGGSTKSYDYVRQHNEAVSRIDFITPGCEITADYAPGEVVEVEQHDGSVLRLRKLHTDYDPTDRYAAMGYMQQHQARGEVVTGLLYVDPLATDLHTALNTCAVPLNTLNATQLNPGAQALEKINAALR